MKIFRKQEGFTLVELLIAIMTGSIVTLAAVTVLLLGLRLNNASSGTATRQNNARILLSVLESMAAEGDIHEIKVNFNDWEILDEMGNSLFSYSQSKQTVYTRDGTTLIEDIWSSYIDLNGNLLTVSVTNDNGTYMSSVFCRMIPTQENPPVDRDEETAGKTEGIYKDLTDNKDDNDGISDENTIKARAAFLKVLLSQYQLKDGRANPGVILDNGYSTGEHYTEWFIYGYNDRNPGWNKETPWCACYVSWCINKIEEDWIDPNDIPVDYAHWYDNVDDFMEYFLELNQNKESWKKSKAWDIASPNPIPGDIIFFDWTMTANKWYLWKNTQDAEVKKNNAPNPSHVGVVIHVDEATNDVYTIEGNTGGRVAIRKYPITDPNIIGYGVMPWKTSP